MSAFCRLSVAARRRFPETSTKTEEDLEWWWNDDASPTWTNEEDGCWRPGGFLRCREETYVFKDKIFRGKSGSVHRYVSEITSDRYLAVKRPTFDGALLEECRAIEQHLTAPCGQVPAKVVVDPDGTKCVAMPYMPYTLEDCAGELSQTDALVLIGTVVAQVELLHSQCGLVYMDVKPENVLIRPVGNDLYQVALGDLGSLELASSRDAACSLPNPFVPESVETAAARDMQCSRLVAADIRHALFSCLYSFLWASGICGERLKHEVNFLARCDSGSGTPRLFQSRTDIETFFEAHRRTIRDALREALLRCKPGVAERWASVLARRAGIGDIPGARKRKGGPDA